MAIQSKTNGTVQSVAHAGSAFSATVHFPQPLPDGVTVTFACTESYYRDFDTALCGAKQVDVVYDDTNNQPSSVTTH